MFSLLGSLTLALVNVLFATITLTVGFAAGWSVCGARRRKRDVAASIGEGGTSTSDRALMAIGQVQDVATRVAQDVDTHSSEVEKMSAELALLQGGNGSSRGDSVVGIIAKVLRANAKLQAQLAVAEEKLEAQAAEIATQQNAARTDPLTGLPNRRALDLEVSRRLAEWQRKGTPFAVLLLDLDCFKIVNDTHGHHAGDEVLRQVGRSLSETMREMDLPCRYGGEEFVVVMPATTLDLAVRAAERSRSAIERHQFRWQDQQLKITVSYGVAQIIPGDDVQSVLRRADDALYRAKRSGRNCGFLHDGSQCRPTSPRNQPVVSPRLGAPAPEIRLLFTLPQRPAFGQELERRVGESQRYGLPLSLMYVQVVDAPEIAARHGERTMHLVLDVVAHRLQDTIRELDFLALEDDGRFAVLLPGSTTAEAGQVAKRIQTMHACQTVTIQDVAVRASLAVALASYRAGDDAGSLSLRAERALEESRSGIVERMAPLVT